MTADVLVHAGLDLGLESLVGAKLAFVNATRSFLVGEQEVGFDLFQGYLLSRPEAIAGKSLSPSTLTCLRVLKKLCDPGTSFDEVERIVQTDAALCYRFMCAAGAGAARGLSRRLSSVRDAVVLLGERRLRAWVMLMLLAGAHDGPTSSSTSA